MQLAMLARGPLTLDLLSVQQASKHMCMQKIEICCCKGPMMSRLAAADL